MFILLWGGVLRKHCDRGAKIDSREKEEIERQIERNKNNGRNF